MDNLLDRRRMRPWMWIVLAMAIAGLLVGAALLRTSAEEPASAAAPQAASLGAAPTPMQPQAALLGAVPSGATTETILSAQGPACLACVQRNGCLDPAQQGMSCEKTAGRAHLLEANPGSGGSCAALLGGAEPAESEVCVRTLHGIFSSGCASARWLTPCLCGSTDPAACLEGTAPTAGPLAGIYACDFNSARSADIEANFQVQTFGAGTANAIVLCAAQSECPCFGD